MIDELAADHRPNVVAVDGFPASTVAVTWALTEVACGGRAVDAGTALTPGPLL
jgi:hypothetical protein